MMLSQGRLQQRVGVRDWVAREQSRENESMRVERCRVRISLFPASSESESLCHSSFARVTQTVQSLTAVSEGNTIFTLKEWCPVFFSRVTSPSSVSRVIQVACNRERKCDMHKTTGGWGLTDWLPFHLWPLPFLVSSGAEECISSLSLVSSGGIIDESIITRTHCHHHVSFLYCFCVLYQVFSTSPDSRPAREVIFHSDRTKMWMHRESLVKLPASNNLTIEGIDRTWINLIEWESNETRGTHGQVL